MNTHEQRKPDQHAHKHPFCNVCGWRKGGVDSWDGIRCKCGHREPPMPCPMCGYRGEVPA